MAAYYNELDPYAASWLRNLIAAGHLPAGHVDQRDIRAVRPGDLAGFAQCHFFAGIGGWAYAARLAGWPNDRPLWTGSPPCQPFSLAGRRAGESDPRHLWPELHRLVRACRPAVLMGEQVAAAIGAGWFDRVRSDLAGDGYACRGVVVPACAVGAPHRRDRLWFVADAGGGAAQRRGGPDKLPGAAGAAQSPWDQRQRSGDAAADHGEGGCGLGCALADAGRPGSPDAEQPGKSAQAQRWLDARPAAAKRGRARDAWAGAAWIAGADGKARRVGPGIRLMAHGIPARVGQLRAYGNAIVPQVAAEVIGAYLEADGLD